MSDETILGVGQLAIDGRVIENPTTFEIALEKDELSLPNLGTPGGGEYVKKTRIKSIGFTATVHDFSASTLARFLSGEASSVATAVITDEPMTAKLGKLVATQNLIETTSAVTVTNTAGDTTYVLDTDYVVSAAGIRTLNGGSITDAQDLLIDYVSSDAGVVELATRVAADVEVIFDGWNDQKNQPVVGRFYRVAIDSDGNIPLISEGYGGATMKGSMLIDSAKPASKSRYGKLSVGGVPVL